MERLRICRWPLFLTTVALALLLIQTGCKKEDPVEPATLTTASVSEITSTSAKSGGNITGDGGSSVTTRGVCWGTSPGPTVSSNKTSDGSGTGSFTSNLTGLSRNTTYYLRAYATNEAGTSYGNEVQFLTLGELATVTTAAVTGLEPTSAVGGGNVTGDGGVTVTARGVVWNTSENPTLENKAGYTTDGGGTGEFTSEITGLTPKTDYYARAYATNSIGTVYGNQQWFRTPSNDGRPCPGMPTFTDERDGTEYHTVQIGEQCWITENLKYLPEVYPSSEGSITESRYYVSGYQGTVVSTAKASANYINYGVLYNWPASLDACPAGWHLPGDEEWSQLVDYLMDEYDLTNVHNDVNSVGNKLKSCRQVNSPLGGDCATTEHPRWDADNTHYGTDEFGFSALPGGFRSDVGFFRLTSHLYWWSSTMLSGSQAIWDREINYTTGWINRTSSSAEIGFSVRCVKSD